MIKVYHGKNTRSLRALWVLEELGVPYETEIVEFTPNALQSEAYLAINPMAALPSMTDDDLVINESGAIVQYILAKEGKGRLEPKAGTKEHGRYLHWFHFAEATAMPPVSTMAQNLFIKPEDKRIPATIPEAQEKITKMLGILEKDLGDRQYIAGDDFTAADIMMGYFLLLAKMFGVMGEGFPKTSAYFDRLAARPAFQKASA